MAAVALTSPAGTRTVGGPPLWVPITAYALLAVAGAVLYPGLRPGMDSGAALALLRGSPVRADVAAVLVVASAAPLAVWSAAVAHRLWALGARVAGPVIGLAGGLLAASALVSSGLAAWAASTVASTGDAGAVAVATSLSFAAGGPGFALASGLLLAGVAVPAGLYGMLPRPFAVVGLVLAVAGAAAPLGLVTSALFGLLPFVRFGGMLWCLTASVLLARRTS